MLFCGSGAVIFFSWQPDHEAIFVQLPPYCGSRNSCTSLLQSSLYFSWSNFFASWNLCWSAWLGIDSSSCSTLLYQTKQYWPAFSMLWISFYILFLICTVQLSSLSELLTAFAIHLKMAAGRYFKHLSAHKVYQLVHIMKPDIHGYINFWSEPFWWFQWLLLFKKGTLSYVIMIGLAPIWTCDFVV